VEHCFIFILAWPLRLENQQAFVEAVILKSLLGSRLSTRQALGVGRKREPDYITLLLRADTTKAGCPFALTAALMRLKAKRLTQTLSGI